MAVFAIFSNSNEPTTDSYGEFIERLQREAKLELRRKPQFAPASSFKYYTTHKDEIKQHVSKDFIYQLRMKMLEGGPCLLIGDNPTPKLKFFIHLIEQVKLPSNATAISYYGEIKSIITAFMNYFTTLIDETGKKINKYTHFLDNKLLVTLIDDTVATYEDNHALFLEQYLPINSENEKENYQQVIDEHAKFLEEMEMIRAHWEFKQDKLDIFAKKTFEAAIQKMSDVFNFTHGYISMMLRDRLYEIAVSVEETAIRLMCNLQKWKEESNDKKNMLIQNLYEKNKEHLEIYRRLNNRSSDTAEVNRTMDLLREKIKHCGNEETHARLELETRFWNKRLREFNEIATMLINIRIELDNLEADRKKYKTITCMELPGAKTVCFELMGENYDERISVLQQKQLETSRALITYFSVRGTDRVMYTDITGTFHIDEFNHQNYISNYGWKFFHLNCDGEFVEYSLNTPYYFDDCGRYTLDEKGEKIHQVAPCTSQYKLGEDLLLKKITKDCGHSEKPNPDCRLEEIKDLSDKEILPKKDPIDITGTLDSESVKYLWESFGMILPEVLYEVATKQPKNPIHAMARLLIRRKFEASAKDLRNMKNNAKKYRNDIIKEREDKAIKERRAWKANLYKRSKPEDSDDYTNRAYGHAIDFQLADSLGYYY